MPRPELGDQHCSNPISVPTIRSLQTSPPAVQVRPNDPNTLQPSPVEKRYHQLAPSVGTTVPLQIKLITQLLMVSTRNTSRSNANPPRMQDPPGDADSRPPGTLEAMQANTSEVEALRLTNQRLIGELEQLTRQMQRPQEARQTQECHNIPPLEGKHNLDIPRGAETKAESSRARGHGLQLALGEEGNRQRKEALQPTKKRAGQTSNEDGALKNKGTERGLQRKMENGPRKGTETSETVWAHLNPRDDNVTHLGGSPP